MLRPLRNAMAEPSGDHAGSSSKNAPLLVCWIRPVPSSRAEKISRSLPSRRDAQAMRVPSGDQVGSMSAPGVVVNGTTLAPSAAAMKMSSSPLSLRVNANRVPSGDHAASSSASTVEVRCVSGSPPGGMV